MTCADGRKVHSTAVLAFSCAATALATAAATRVLSRSLRLRSLATAAAAPDAPDASARAPAIAMTERTDAADLVQFVVVRRDLLTSLSWPVGSVIAQACHACTAVSWSCRDDADVQAYLQAEDSMTKVVKECKGEKQLLALAGAPGALAAGSRTHPLVGTRRPPYLPAAEKLRAESIEHKVWMEQPENIPTAIALKPCARSRVAPLLKKYSLFK